MARLPFVGSAAAKLKLFAQLTKPQKSKLCHLELSIVYLFQTIKITLSSEPGIHMRCTQLIC